MTPSLAKARKDLFSDAVSIRAPDDVPSFRFGEVLESKAENLPPPIFEIVVMDAPQFLQCPKS